MKAVIQVGGKFLCNGCRLSGFEGTFRAGCRRGC